MHSDRSLTGSNLKTAAAWNRGLVLRLLRQHGMLSRRQIADMVGLRGSTLTYIMRELLDRNLVYVVGKLESNRVGKKQVMLTINPHLGWFVGLALRPREASVVFVDAAGNQIGEQKLAIQGALEHLPDQLRGALENWSALTAEFSGKLLGVGVGIPGVVDANAGIVLRSTLFNATRVPLKQLLAEQFQVPVAIDHDACYGAGAEAAHGAARGVSYFIHFLVNHEDKGDRVRFFSYGSSLFLAGKIYRGAHYAAGEWGIPLLPPDTTVTAEEFSALASEDAEISPALATLATAIGRSLGAAVNLIDVQMVVVAGTARIVNRAFLNAVSEELGRRLVAIADRAVKLVPSALPFNAVARGAALAALDATLADSRTMTLTASPAAVPEFAAVRPMESAPVQG